MAPRAGEARARTVAQLVRLLGPSPGRLAFAARLALICTLSTLVVEIYQTPSAALTAYVVFFLNKPDRVESALIDVVFGLLISLLLGFIVLVAVAVIDDSLWRIVAMTVFSFTLLFLTSASKLRPIGAILALIVAYSLAILGTVPDGELGTRALLYTWLVVGIPAGVSLVVNPWLAPAPRKLAERAIAGRLRLAGAMLRAPDERSRNALTEALREGGSEIQNWLKLAAVERTSPAQDVAALRQAAQSTAEILLWIDAADRCPDELPLALRARLAQTLDDMASILIRGGYPVDVAVDDAELYAMMADRPGRIWSNLRSLLAHFADPHGSRPETDARSGFFLPDAFTNPEHVQYALKATAAAMFCYLLYSLLDWPGIHTCFITCFIVALTTTAETVQKLALRIVGCLVGAAAGIAAIVFVLPSLTSIETLLAVVFLGALCAAWVAAGSPRIAYAGFQMAFAFFLCVIQGPGPEFDLTVARDRIIGILLGNLVVYLLFTRLWPVSVAQRVDAAIGLLREKLRALKSAAREGRPALAAETQVAIGAIERDLELAEYEPRSVRPGDHWLRSRRRIVGKVGALVPALLLAGCATSALDMAPSRPDRPWTPAVTATGEIVAGAKPAPVSTNASSYRLPVNTELAAVPAPPDVDPEWPYSLAELIDIAESSNPITRIAWNAAREAALVAGIAHGAYLPRLSASVIHGHLDSHDQTSALGADSTNDTTADGTISALSLQWLLFDFGGREARENAAKQGSVIANIAFTAAHQQVIHDVSLAFYAHAAAQARVDTAARSLQNARDVQAAAEDRYAHEIGTIIEVAQARQATAQARLLEVQARGAEENAYQALVSAMGISPLTRIRTADIADRELPIATANSVERIVAEALGRRPDVLSAHAAQLASAENARAARAQFLPKFFLSATAAYNDGHLDVTAIPSIGEQLPTVNLSQDGRDVTLFAGVTMPIYDGGTRAAVLRQAEATADSAALALTRTQEEAVRQIVVAENALRTSLSAHEAASALVTAAQTTFDAALDAYRNGVGSITDATIAETQLLQAQNARTDAHSAALSAAATLALAAGALGSAPQ